MRGGEALRKEGGEARLGAWLCGTGLGLVLLGGAGELDMTGVRRLGEGEGGLRLYSLLDIDVLVYSFKLEMVFFTFP